MKSKIEQKGKNEFFKDVVVNQIVSGGVGSLGDFWRLLNKMASNRVRLKAHAKEKRKNNS